MSWKRRCLASHTFFSLLGLTKKSLFFSKTYNMHFLGAILGLTRLVFVAKISKFLRHILGWKHEMKPKVQLKTCRRRLCQEPQRGIFEHGQTAETVQNWLPVPFC